MKTFPLPEGSDANLDTATFDRQGILWFTGQTGVYRRLEPTSGQLEVFEAPKGRGPYGIATAPDGSVYYLSLAGSYQARIDSKTGLLLAAAEPPSPWGAVGLSGFRINSI